MNSHYNLEKNLIRLVYLILNVSRMKKKQPNLRNIISNDPKALRNKFD